MFCMYISTQLASQLAMKHPAQLVLTKYVKIDGRNRSDKFHDFVDVDLIGPISTIDFYMFCQN